MEQSKTKQTNNSLGVRFEKPTIGKTVCLLLILTALTLLSACSTTETNEPKWNDMYEVRTYDIHTEVITNEIITTVFIQKCVETNRVIAVGKQVEEDFGGYEFQPAEEEKGEIELQCVDGSCEVKK